MTTEEQVLCSRTSDLPRAWMPEVGFIQLSEETLIRQLDAIAPVWLPRPVAESAAEFKQWIPYVLLLDGNGRWAAYPRRGGESRLHGVWSLGLGGHINPCDAPSAGSFEGSPWRALLWNGLLRELAEEFPAALQGTTHFLGLIHENQSEVGRVHLGAVFLHRVSDVTAPPSAELTGLIWIDDDQLATVWKLDGFELWSQLAIALARSSPKL